MSDELTLYLTDDLQAIIQRVNELNALVKGKEIEAETEGRKIDYAEFPEYTELHNLHSDRGCKSFCVTARFIDEELAAPQTQS